MSTKRLEEVVLLRKKKKYLLSWSVSKFPFHPRQGKVPLRKPHEKYTDPEFQLSEVMLEAVSADNASTEKCPNVFLNFVVDGAYNLEVSNADEILKRIPNKSFISKGQNFSLVLRQ